MSGADGMPHRRDASAPSLLEAVLRRPLYVVLPLLIGGAGALAASLMVKKAYRSSTLILVEREKVPESFVPKVAQEDPARRLLTIRQEMLSRTRLEKVLTELVPYPDAVARVPVTQLVERMRAAITINVKGNDAFSVEYVHTDPRMAMRGADRLAQLFIEETVRTQELRVIDASRFIESQLEEARQQLEEREAQLRRYKEQHMGALPEQLAPNLATLQRLQLEQQANAANLQAALGRLAVQEGTGGAPPAPGLTDLDAMRAQLRTLRQRYTDEHPEVRQTIDRVQQMERELQANAPASRPPAAVGVTQAKVEVDGLRSRGEAIDRRIAELQARVDQVPRVEQELATLTRDFQKLRENYLAILNKKLDAHMAQRLEERWQGQRFRILDPAFLPEEATYPNRWVFLGLGLLGGLLGGLGLAFAVECADHSAKHPDQLEQALSFPVLATIPHIRPTAARTTFARTAYAGRKR